MIIPREGFVDKINKSLKHNPITAILGPRQCGKTTLAKHVSNSKETSFFDLEDPEDYELLNSSPKNILNQQHGLVVIDEIQRLPGLFSLLRVLSDQDGAIGKFLILGSAAPELIKKSSETLAGRISFVHLGGFLINEVGPENIEKLWLRGGFPKSYLAQDDEQSFSWRNDFIQTFLERDILQLGFNIPSVTLRRFWLMLAHYHGQIWNGAEFSRAMGVSEPTVKRYLDILTGAFMVRQLQPWYENMKKRQVKAPKVYIRDSGIVHSLLTLEGNEIYSHPKVGASWEGFIIEMLIQKMNTRECYFWKTHSGAELDLLVIKNGKRIGFEIKFSESPKISKSMYNVIEDLKLDHLYIVSRSKRNILLAEGITLLPVEQISQTKF